MDKVTPLHPRQSANPEAIKQLEKLKEAAVLASQDKFRCTVCKQVHAIRDGVLIVARKNVLLGVCMDCSRATQVILQPMPDGQGMNILVQGPEQADTPRVKLANLSDIRAVETSKLSMQTAEKTELGGDK